MHPMLPLLLVGNGFALLQARTSDLLPSDNIEVELVTDEAAFTELRDAWNAIVDTHPEPSVFLRHEWFDAAWQWRKRDAFLRIMAFYKEGRLIGIAPTILSASSAVLSQRRFTFLTVPDTQHCDLIAAPGDLHDVVTAFALKLYAMRRAWDVIDLSHFSETSSACALLSDLLPAHGILSQRTPMSGNPYVSLSDSWENYYASRSRRLKKHVNQTGNRVAKLGEVRVCRVTGMGEPAVQVSKALDESVAISMKSWKSGTEYALGNEGPNAFIRRLTAHARRNGWLSLWLMYVNGKPVASEYQLEFNGNVHALRADFDDAYGAQSVGSHLNFCVLRGLFDQGLVRYYMGPGDNSYKFRWAKDDRPLTVLRGYASTPRGGYAYLRRLGVRSLAAVRRAVRRREKGLTA